MEVAAAGGWEKMTWTSDMDHHHSTSYVPLPPAVTVRPAVAAPM